MYKVLREHLTCLYLRPRNIFRLVLFEFSSAGHKNPIRTQSIAIYFENFTEETVFTNKTENTFKNFLHKQPLKVRSFQNTFWALVYNLCMKRTDFQSFHNIKLHDSYFFGIFTTESELLPASHANGFIILFVLSIGNFSYLPFYSIKNYEALQACVQLV